MYIFVDEAGDFATPSAPDEHRVAVSAAVAFNDRAWEAFQRSFVGFRAGLHPNELARGEPKWHLLSDGHRNDFCGLFRRGDGVSVTPVILDLGHMVGREGEWLTPLLRKLEALSLDMVHEVARREVELLHRQASNLSTVQHLRIYSWAYAIYQSLFHSILFLGHGEDGASWERVAIEVDAVHRAPANREELVFRTLLLAWLTGWSEKRPFALIQGVHTDQHPFVKNFDTAQGIEMGKLVTPNLSFGVSASNDGLQVADLIASAVYAATSEPNNTAALGYFSLLMQRACYYPAQMGPGLHTPFADDMEHIATKYDFLAAAMGRTAG